MELTIKRENFLKPLQLVFGAVERKQISPILSNVMLVAEGNRLSVTATDLEIELIGEVALDSPVISPGETTASARKLIDICKTLPEKAEIKIRTEKSR